MAEAKVRFADLARHVCFSETGEPLPKERISAKTPLLGDLPFIGRLFRYTEESNEKVELLVFITPRLLDDGLAVR